jgi:NAD(P)-dependent dehydrogenase (short-subunit alcohol dehydrogenase family)
MTAQKSRRQLSGNVDIVTGGGTGAGLSMAEELRARGCLELLEDG